MCVSQRQDVYYHIENNNASTFLKKIEEIFYFVCKVDVIYTDYPKIPISRLIKIAKTMAHMIFFVFAFTCAPIVPVKGFAG